MTPDAPTPSARITRARAAATERLHRQRALLRPLGWAVIGVVAATTITTRPVPGLSGIAAAVSVALIAYAAATAVAIGDRFIDRPGWAQAAVLTLMGAAGVVLVGLQPRGATGLAAGAAVWMAITRLPTMTGAVLGAAVTAGQLATLVLAGASTALVAAAVLFNALMGLAAYVVRTARAGQDRTELLMARLADAQDEQIRAAALAERGRIAGELHDVLAHCLSGAAIQLQGARVLLTREHAGTGPVAAVQRASELVNDGLTNARIAVGALRGEPLPGVADLPALIDQYRHDLLVPAVYTVTGTPHPVPAEIGLLIYRGAQEALTNIARYAPGAPTTVDLHYHPSSTILSVENQAAPTRHFTDHLAETAGLPNVGGGHGLTGLHERLQHAGGTLHAGPSPGGWRVDLEVPE